jgi:hypothetical protein
VRPSKRSSGTKPGTPAADRFDLLALPIEALRKLVSDSRERIKQRHAGHDNVRDIAGHKCQAVHFGSRREQAVDQRQRIGNSQERPGFRDRLVDRQNAPPESTRARPRPYGGKFKKASRNVVKWRARNDSNVRPSDS